MRHFFFFFSHFFVAWFRSGLIPEEGARFRMLMDDHIPESTLHQLSPSDEPIQFFMIGISDEGKKKLTFVGRPVDLGGGVFAFEPTSDNHFSGSPVCALVKENDLVSSIHVCFMICGQLLGTHKFGYGYAIWNVHNDIRATLTAGQGAQSKTTTADAIMDNDPVFQLDRDHPSIVKMVYNLCYCGLEFSNLQKYSSQLAALDQFAAEQWMHRHDILGSLFEIVEPDDIRESFQLSKGLDPLRPFYTNDDLLHLDYARQVMAGGAQFKSEYNQMRTNQDGHKILKPPKGALLGEAPEIPIIPKSEPDTFFDELRSSNTQYYFHGCSWLHAMHIITRGMRARFTLAADYSDFGKAVYLNDTALGPHGARAWAERQRPFAPSDPVYVFCYRKQEIDNLVAPTHLTGQDWIDAVDEFRGYGSFERLDDRNSLSGQIAMRVSGQWQAMAGTFQLALRTASLAAQIDQYLAFVIELRN